QVVAMHGAHLDIAAGGDDAADPGLGMGGEIGERDRVVDAGVAVDQEGESHGPSLRSSRWRGGLACGRIAGWRMRRCPMTIRCSSRSDRSRPSLLPTSAPMNGVDPDAASGPTVDPMTETTVHEDLTVGRVADLVGVSVRTLHHWDA